MSTKIQLCIVLVIACLFTPSRAYAQDITTWETVVELLNAKGITFTYGDWPGGDYLHLRCYAKVVPPEGASLNFLEEMTGLNWTQLKQAGFTGGYDGLQVFEVDKSYCNRSGGGGTSLQFTAKYIWLLIFMAILAMISASSRLRLIPV